MKVNVPEGMLAAVKNRYGTHGEWSVEERRADLEAALEWARENPQPLSPGQYVALMSNYLAGVDQWSIYRFLWEETQRRCFLTSESEVLDEADNLCSE